MKTCSKCGAVNTDNATFCGSCGTDLSGVPAVTGGSAAGGGAQQVSLPIQLIVIGGIGLLAVGCLLVLVIVGLVGEKSSDTTMVVLGIVPSLIRLYAFLLALLGGYTLVSKMNLSQLFSPVKGWMRFLLLVAVAELLYMPLSFIFDRVFTFASRYHHIVYSLERLVEGGFLIVVLAGVFWLLAREDK